MTRRTQLASMLGLGSALLLSSAVYAQPGGPGGRPGGPGGAGAPAPAAPGAPGAETGVVSNETTTSTTTTTNFDASGIPTDQPADTLPNTGGAPWLMALAGSATAGSALLLRRKLG